MMKAKVIGACAVLLALAAVSCFAQQVGREIGYRGFLSDSAGQALNGSYGMGFALYDAESGGTQLWSEVQTVQVLDGEFSVRLGVVAALNDTSKATRGTRVRRGLQARTVRPRGLP